MVTLTFTVPEFRLILKAIEITDPHKMYVGALTARMVKEANEQLKPKEEVLNPENAKIEPTDA